MAASLIKGPLQLPKTRPEHAVHLAVLERPVHSARAVRDIFADPFNGIASGQSKEQSQYKHQSHIFTPQPTRHRAGTQSNLRTSVSYPPQISTTWNAPVSISENARSV